MYVHVFVCRGIPVRDPDKPKKYEYLINFCGGRMCDNDFGVGAGKNSVVSGLIF